MIEIEKAYDAKKYENEIYEKWEKSNAFKAKVNPDKTPFTIILPPPNATGTLHLGHATMLAIEDTIIRFKRMQGFEALWLPGIDHAAIATQTKVEKDLFQKEKKTRHDLGREEFLKRVEAFVEQSKAIIINQMRRMGASCDWDRLSYTLEPRINKAVYEIFKRMYNDGLIYRGKRIVNWCPRCSSTLSDDEVQFKEEKTKFYYLKYGPVVIATARPETKFLDKVIVAHPEDQRYQKYFGTKIPVSWIDGEVEATFIADEKADPNFGSGAMTITPAHDFTDFEIAQKHKLEIVEIIDEKGNFTSRVGPEFVGKNARKSREAIIEKLQAKGLVEKIDENYVHNLSVCYRCSTPVEPLISEQWFIDVNKQNVEYGGKKMSIKEILLQVVREKEIEIIPERFDKNYFYWIENLRDWCISRQIWFGHRIPVWYCKNAESSNPECKKPIVESQKPEVCPHCKGNILEQDPDTLDTWFSSGLWTFSTLGWPEQTPDLKYFHPTSLLETGYDILFFWVARMIIMSTYALHEIPFKQVYLHGLIRDKNGQKMSKSKDNGIDPLEMIEKFGTDAVRLSLMIGSTPGNDMRLYEEKIAGYRNFVNKIWNSCRFVLLNLNEESNHEVITQADLKSTADKWIVSKLQHLIVETTANLEKYQLSEAGNRIYEFIWDEFCNWYLEFSKSEHQNPKILKYVLETVLKLLHPFTPFITETLWKHLGNEDLLMIQEWPKHQTELIDIESVKSVELIKKIINEIRSIRAEKKIEPVKKIKAVIYAKNYLPLFQEKNSSLKLMARLEELELQEDGPKLDQALWKYIDGIDLYLPLKDLFDPEKEKARIQKQLAEVRSKIEYYQGRLQNEGFRSKAPAVLIEKEENLLKELIETEENYQKNLADLLK